MTHYKGERDFEILGVKGRMGAMHLWPNGLFMHQTWKSAWREYTNDYGDKARLRVEIRLDDNCKNGHEDFAITGSGDIKLGNGHWRDDIGGCCHDEIAKVFPELACLIKWHLCGTRGTMHGVANALYHASNRDHNGLLEGEEKQIRNGKTKKPCWRPRVVTWNDNQWEDINIHSIRDGEIDELPELKVTWDPVTRTGEGKERNFKAARNLFPTLELTDDVLMKEKDELRPILEGLMPAVIEHWKMAMDKIGLEYHEEQTA